jgi:hypothetical protein
LDGCIHTLSNDLLKINTLADKMTKFFFVDLNKVWEFQNGEGSLALVREYRIAQVVSLWGF